MCEIDRKKIFFYAVSSLCISSVCFAGPGDTLKALNRPEGYVDDYSPNRNEGNQASVMSFPRKTILFEGRCGTKREKEVPTSGEGGSGLVKTYQGELQDHQVQVQSDGLGKLLITFCAQDVGEKIPASGKPCTTLFAGDPKDLCAHEIRQRYTTKALKLLKDAAVDAATLPAAPVTVMSVVGQALSTGQSVYSISSASVCAFTKQISSYLSKEQKKFPFERECAANRMSELLGIIGDNPLSKKYPMVFRTNDEFHGDKNKLRQGWILPLNEGGAFIKETALPVSPAPAAAPTQR